MYFYNTQSRIGEANLANKKIHHTTKVVCSPITNLLSKDNFYNNTIFRGG